MPEITKDNSSSDISGLFSTYKSSTPENEKNTIQSLLINNPEHTKTSALHQEEDIYRVKWGTFFEKSMFIFQIITLRIVRIFQILMTSFVNITRIALWGIAVFGTLFIAALATNTMDRTVEIINSSLLSKWWKSISIPPEKDSEYDVIVGAEKIPQTTTSGLSSNVLNPPPTTAPESIINTRRAILEARKTAKMQEEKQKALEQSIDN